MNIHSRGRLLAASPPARVNSRTCNRKRIGLASLSLLLLAVCGAQFVAAPRAAWAHGFAGQRFFPATLTIDDPFVADEGDILLGRSRTPNDDGGDVTTNSTSLEFAKRITSNLGVSVATEYDNLQLSNGDPSLRGFNNLEVGVRYLSLVSADHESLVSVGLNAALGGTGSKTISDSFSTISPIVLFGKGFGDLPDSVWYLRPVAVTGALSPNITTDSSAPDSLDWGFTFQYSLPYLQAFVRDVGLREPFNHLIPVIEAPMNTCLNLGCGGQTTGTINPGMIWFSRWGQLGIEATVPVNSRSGSHVGLLFQLHFYFDDLFPKSLGKPLIGP